jgi:hypothetical protein
LNPLFSRIFSLTRRLFVERCGRRARLFVGVVLLLSCATTVRHVDEAQVRTIASKRFDCDEQLVEVFAEPSNSKGVAYYEIRACNKTATYACTEENRVVDCDDTAKATTSSDASSTSDYDASGCNCGNLFASHHSSPATTPATTSVMPTQPQNDRNQR